LSETLAYQTWDVLGIQVMSDQFMEKDFAVVVAVAFVLLSPIAP